MKKITEIITNYLTLLRVKQWIKNSIIFAPLIFALKLFEFPLLFKSILAFLSFTFASVFVYIINDIKDINTDSCHPIKSQRPLPAKKISIRFALIIASIFLIISFMLSSFSMQASGIVLIYVLMNILYSFRLKHIVILDVFIIALGFCLRVLMGAISINVPLSSWMLLATFSISLVLGFGKRRHELVLLKDDARLHRAILGEYSKKILDIMITIATGLAVISYAMYSVDSSLVERFHTEALIYTFPAVMYGLFRYLYIVYHKEKGGTPEEDLITDRGLLTAVFVWLVLVILILYHQQITTFIKQIAQSYSEKPFCWIFYV